MLLLSCSWLSAQDEKTLVDFIETRDSIQVACLNEAVPLIEKGYPFHAIKVLKKGLRKSPDFYEAHLFLGYLYNATGKKARGSYHYGQAININPSEPIAYFMRGNLFLTQDLYRAALVDFQRCVHYDSTFYRAYNNMALIRLFNQGGSGYVHLNDFKMAREDFISMMYKTDFVDKDVFFNIGLVHLQLADYRQAIRFFNKTIELDTAYGKAFFYRGVSNFRLRRFSPAAKDFSQSELLGYHARESHDYLSFIKIIDKP